MTLTQIASAAVRVINKENGISLRKVSEAGDAILGSVIYKDKDYSEYRVIFIRDGAHQVKADYHTTDKQDAIDTAAAFLTKPDGPAHKTEHEKSLEKVLNDDAPVAQGINPTEAPEAKTLKVQRPRPRGYHEKPSRLFGALFNRLGA